MNICLNTFKFNLISKLSIEVCYTLNPVTHNKEEYVSSEHNGPIVLLIFMKSDHYVLMKILTWYIAVPLKVHSIKTSVLSHM